MLNKCDKKKIYIVNKFIKNNINNFKSYEWKQGYKIFGILLVGFCKWIYESSKENKVDKIFFLSREGYIIKKIYEIMYPGENVSYFYVSRRSLSLPSIKDSKNIQEILECLILPPIFTIDVIFSAFSLDINQFEKELKEINIGKDEIFLRNSFKNNKKIIQLMEKIYNKILVNANEQYKNFILYLKQEEFNENVGIVDIGWHNSMQKSILKIAKKTSICGYYLGVYKEAITFENNNISKGYLYSYGNNISRQYKTFSFVSLLESMFLSHEGTVISYKKINDIIVPNLADYEYENEPISLKVIRDFQDGAIQFVKDFINSNISDMELNSNICSYNILKFGNVPTKDDLEIFGNLSFENYKKHNIINFNNSSIYYFFHPRTMIKDFYKSGWRIAFLKKLFKIPLPYSFIMRTICVLLKKG